MVSVESLVRDIIALCGGGIVCELEIKGLEFVFNDYLIKEELGLDEACIVVYTYNVIYFQYRNPFQ